MFDILTAKAPGPRTRHRAPQLSQAIIEILRDTRRNLPPYFKAAAAPVR